MEDSLLLKLIESGDVQGLNRFVATQKLDKDKIISNFKEEPPELYLGPSSIHGQGVFNKRPLSVGQLIETVRIIGLEFRSKYHKDSILLDYCYAFPEISDETQKHGHQLFIFTGYGMMYNHSNEKTCNAKWLWDLPNSSAKIIAIKNIKENTEITIDYGKGYWAKKQ